MTTEGCEDVLELRVLCTTGHGALHEQSYPVAYKTTDVVNRVFRHAVLTQCVVDARRKVVQRVE